MRRDVDCMFQKYQKGIKSRNNAGFSFWSFHSLGEGCKLWCNFVKSKNSDELALLGDKSTAVRPVNL